MDAHDLPLDSLGLFYPVVSSFGGGLNSTALLIKWVLEDIRPVDKILFADTGNERPETYEHIERFSLWLEMCGMPHIEVVKKGGRVETLEGYALRLKHLPSVAYGHKTCSHKFKIEPQNRETNRWPEARAAWKRGDKVVKLIGYGFEEQKRLAKAKLEDDKFFYRFPLNEWEIDRDDCADLCRYVGLPVPPKSSCFFCPNSKKHEILDLREKHPDLLARAIHIEAVAFDAGNVRKTKGLGRQFAWRDFIAGQEVAEAPTANCMYCADDDGITREQRCTN